MKLNATKFRKVLSGVIAAALALSLSPFSALADTGGADGSGTQLYAVGENNTISKTSDDESELTNYVKVSWTSTAGSAVSAGDTYRWDASECRYVRTAQTSTLSSNTPAGVEITVTNDSTSAVQYEIAYAGGTGYDTTESADRKAEGSSETYSKTGVIDAKSGEAAASAQYKGSITLNSQATALSNQTVGTYTVKIVAFDAASQWRMAEPVTANTAESQPTTLSYSAPASGTTQKYVEVTVPSDAKYDADGDGAADTTIEAGSTLSLQVRPDATPSGITVASDDSSATYDVSLLKVVTDVTTGATSTYKVSAGDTPLTVQLYVGDVDLTLFSHVDDAGAVTPYAKVDKTAFATAPIGSYYYENGYVYFKTGSFSDYTSVYKFAGGQGTADSPYLINSAAKMQGITDEYEEAEGAGGDGDAGSAANTGSYRYYKVKEGTKSIDCTGWVPVSLNGSFDGNGVAFTNVTSCLFLIVGYQLQADAVTLKDFSATMNASASQEYGAAALVKNVFSSGTTTFENVDVHGTIEGYWNLGSYYNYGTANYDDKGCDYTVSFVDCDSDATLICTSGNTCGGFVGHTYEGKGNTVTMAITNSSYTGAIYTTTGKSGAYIAMSSNHGMRGGSGKASDGTSLANTLTVDGSKVVFNDGDNMSAYYYGNAKKIESVAPTSVDGGYTVEVHADAARVVVSVTAQLSAYEPDSVTRVSNLSGITMVLRQESLANVSSGSVLLGRVTSANIDNAASDYGFTLDEGAMVVKVPGDSNYRDGIVRLTVTQYDAAGTILCCGTTDVIQINNTLG